MPTATRRQEDSIKSELHAKVGAIRAARRRDDEYMIEVLHDQINVLLDQLEDECQRKLSTQKR